MLRLRNDSDDVHTPAYAARAFTQSVPKFQLPAEGLAPEAAYQLVHDELNLDGNPVLNLASFVTSWMEPMANQLSQDMQPKNLIDQDEYPQTENIHERVVSMIGGMFHVPKSSQAVGTATIGSSEAIMLGLLAHKRTWQRRREAAGESTERPNIVMGADVHTCWEKFARYFEVEARVIPMEDGRYTVAAEQVEPCLDERTIAVGGVLGTTFTGDMDDLQSINDLLADVEDKRGWRIPLHVDAATGGFVIPFSQPDLEWDFRLSHVRSINVSNHKFGLVYPGMGTVVFREQSDLPEELVFHINYLGGDMPNYSLNFSRASNTVVLQYFNFLRLGRTGYERIIANAMSNAQALGKELAGVDDLQLLNDARDFPIVALRATDPEALDLTAVSHKLRERGWIVPAYTLPANAQDVNILRMVIKENFSRDLVQQLAHDVRDAVKSVLQQTSLHPTRPRRRPAC